MGCPVGVRVELLTAEADAVVIAGWEHETWGVGRDRSEYVDAAKAAVGSRTIPLRFVAKRGEEPIGTAGLIFDDLPGKTDLNPWLASVYVAPRWRDCGIASALVTSVVDAARRLGVTRLYLFTSDAADLYARMGFVDVGEDAFQGEPVLVMALDM